MAEAVASVVYVWVLNSNVRVDDAVQVLVVKGFLSQLSSRVVKRMPSLSVLDEDAMVGGQKRKLMKQMK